VLKTRPAEPTFKKPREKVEPSWLIFRKTFLKTRRVGPVF
jgi:hypothetical protein